MQTSLHSFIIDNLPFPLTVLPDDCYLVGGAVRDVLLQRKKESIDLDFVLPHSAIKIAKNIANLSNAGFVVLDADRHIARIVFPHVTVDIANQEGDSINVDLARRDYTINSIAFHCQKQEIIDPFHGQEDINKGIMRMISQKNLEDDPLRLLRGYRQACQLNFTIESATRATIQQLTSLLSKVAKERINMELEYLFASENGSYWLTEAFRDGLLSIRHPYLSQTKINYLTNIDNSARWFQEKWLEFKSITPSYYQNAKLACFTDNNPENAEQELINLKYSRQDIKSVTTILKYTPSLLKKDFATNLADQYFFFSAVGDILPILAIFAHAHYIDSELIILLVDRYLDDNDIVAHPQPLVTGKEIMESLQIPPSPLIGKLLTDISIAYIEGKINTKDDALQWVKKFR
ncbi:CCA tRNA nucleotidyltransferase [Geminocystis sp. NIES-3709]|uniref:CCA tRNA nucleotidyltransferase n=1 Tax=Geminocystis sp. NIES-3709 TaxID=1617448 RepID=UPI0005FCD39F|nr:CCA tRNA nucleotidyltransferase [Geminocystis sp. NIES-3709]BAQ63648.1 tRNA nucleotidyltransferase [Geminocystis sp. NIES-3709]